MQGGKYHWTFKELEFNIKLKNLQHCNSPVLLCIVRCSLKQRQSNQRHGRCYCQGCYEPDNTILTQNQSWTRLCHNPEQNFETETAEQSHSKSKSLEFRVYIHFRLRLLTWTQTWTLDLDFGLWNWTLDLDCDYMFREMKHYLSRTPINPVNPSNT